MPLGPLPSPGPFGRIVDVRVWPHGFTFQTDSSAIVRPNLEDDDWHASTSPRWGGNILWTGSTPRHTVSYKGPRGRYFGPMSTPDGNATSTWFAHNGAKVIGPTGRVLAACVRTYDSLPTGQTYAGTGDGSLAVQTPSTGPGAMTGDYEIRCTETAAPARFLLTGPDAVPVGVATAGVLFDGAVRILISTGAVPFALGDTWTLTVEEAEQFVVITTPHVGTTPTTETVWRRGVSLSPGSSWRELATIPPVTGQVNGSLQPWFFNASATQADTVRGLGGDANGCTLGVVHRRINLATLHLTDSVETSAPPTYTRVYRVTAASEDNVQALSDTATSNSTGPRSQLMAVDYDGNTPVRIEIEFDGYMDGVSSMVEHAGQPGHEDGLGDVDVSASYSAWADIVWSTGNRLRVFDLSASASMTHHWAPNTDPQVWNHSLDEAITARVVRDIADPRGAKIAYTEYIGTQSQVDDGTEEGFKDSGSATAMRHWLGGALLTEVGGAIAPYDGLYPTSQFVHLSVSPGYPELDSTSPGVVTTETRTIICPAGLGTEGLGTSGLGSDWSIVQTLTYRSQPGYGAIAAATLPDTASGRGFQASATDARGNWLMAAEIAAPTVSLWPGSFPGSGTYADAAGGPDSLTPATVATLTGTATDDRWDVGVF